MRTSEVLILGLAFGTSACEDDPVDAGLKCTPVIDGESRPLVDHALWVSATVEEDPFAEHRPADLDCESAGKLEDFAGSPALEVNTAACGYTTVVQPTLAPACQGETFFVWLWNYALTAPDGGTAFLAVQVGDDLVWQGQRAIPSPANLTYDHLTLPRDVPAGTPIYFHVRNHGLNQYELLDLSIVHPAHADPPE